MMCNLALYIFQQVATEQYLHLSRRGVALSGYRKRNNIPPATFHRHIKSLIDSNMLIRNSRDNYSVHPVLSYMIAGYEIKSNKR